MSKKDGTRICLLNACTSLSIFTSRNDFGIFRSSSLHLQIAQTITLILSLLATLHPTKYMLNTTPSIYNLVFYIPHRGMYISPLKVNWVKMLHTMHNYLFVHHPFQNTNPIIHMNSRLQYANTKLTSPYINYSYIIQPNYCEGTLRNFDPIKNSSFLHSMPRLIAPSSSQSSIYNV